MAKTSEEKLQKRQLKAREKANINSHKLLHSGAQIAHDTPRKFPFFTIWHFTSHLSWVAVDQEQIQAGE